MVFDVTLRERLSGPLNALRERTRRVLDRMRGRRESRHDIHDLPVYPWSGSRLDRFWPVDDATVFPSVDVVDEDEAIRVTAELPGLSPEEFRVEVSDREVFIEGEKKAQRQKHGKGYTFTECSYGSFSRIIPLPCEVDKDQAEARFKHGVLDLRIPKHPSARARRIRVEAG